MNVFAIRCFLRVVTVLTLMHWFPAFSISYRMIADRRCYCSAPSLSTYKCHASPVRIYQEDAAARCSCTGNCYLHRGIVFATARSPVARGSMIESLLCRQHVSLLALPNLQSRLLDGAGKRKRQRPRQSRLESDIHGIQTSRGQFTRIGRPTGTQSPERRRGRFARDTSPWRRPPSFTSSCWRQVNLT